MKRKLRERLEASIGKIQVDIAAAELARFPEYRSTEIDANLHRLAAEHGFSFDEVISYHIARRKRALTADLERVCARLGRRIVRVAND